LGLGASAIAVGLDGLGLGLGFETHDGRAYQGLGLGADLSTASLFGVGFIGGCFISAVCSVVVVVVREDMCFGRKSML
jgi:hypothetical protein